jgi:hypothetical protein
MSAFPSGAVGRRRVACEAGSGVQGVVSREDRPVKLNELAGRLDAELTAQ